MTTPSSESGGGPPLRPGARLGDLTLLREIGRGAQGIIFEGHQVALDRRVAVKVLPQEVTFTDEQVDRFRREAEAAGRLNHPNIVSVYGLEEAHGHLLIVQELVTGGDCEGVLAERTRLNERTDVGHCTWAAGMCRMLAQALQHAHEHEVIHRDIKPGNVLLTENGLPKITDFGLARLDDNRGLSHTGTQMGTPDYMSPEQVNARPSEIDARTDVYSLGAMLYRMLTNEVPFRAQSLQGLFLDILTRAPRAPRKLQPGVSPDLEAVCLKALEKEPGDRYQSAGALATDLERYLRGETTLARPVSIFGRAARSLRRLATSTLAVVTLLVPTAWLALDALLLRPLAAARADLHWVRLGVVGLATLLLAWPLSLLGVRLAQARAWGAVPAWALALAVGGTTGWLVLDQRLIQLHGTARDALSRGVEQEAIGDRRDVEDLDGYVASWGPRFDAMDELLMARALLKRQRPTQADAWVRRITSGSVSSPLLDALAFAIQDALGLEAQAAQAEQRLWSQHPTAASWSDWKRIGDVLRDMQRHEQAQRAYLLAARRPQADRDLLNLDLAQVSTDLCAPEQAQDFLDDFMKWHPDHPAANLLAFQLADQRGDEATAEEHLARYEVHPSVPLDKRIRTRLARLRAKGQQEQAAALESRALAEHGTDPALLGELAIQALDHGKLALARVAILRGDAEAQQDALAAARSEVQEAQARYLEMLALRADSFEAQLGLSAVHMLLARLEPEASIEILDRAVEHARRAVELDPSFWQAHFDLGLATLNRALAEKQALTALDLGELETFVAHMRAALALNGLQVHILNNVAWILGTEIYTRTQDPAALAEALRWAERAVRVTAPGTSCRPTVAAREIHSAAHDTLRVLREIAGDEAGALQSARAALEALPDDHPKRPLRQAEADRLEMPPAEGG